MDNSDDFIASNKSTSKLASLFGIGKASAPDNASLTFTPPKQPKKEANIKTVADSSPTNLKLEVILPKTVHAYKLLDGSYQAIGKAGLALLGNKNPPLYQLLLYRTRDDVICKIRILQKFTFSLLDNNYASFYSDVNQNFSVMFESKSDVEEFSRQVAILRANSEQLTSPIYQDICVGTPSLNDLSGSFCIRFNVSELDAVGCKAVSSPKNVLVDLSSKANPCWYEKLADMKTDGVRVVILPAGTNETSLPSISEKSKVLIEVHRLGTSPTPPSDEHIDSTLESSTEESSVKERGEMIRDSLMMKSQKSNLLSRVARMGQATLPLRGAIAADPSDSEDDSSPSPKPRPRLKPHIETITTARDHKQQSHFVTPVSVQAPQTLALYQSALHPQMLMPRPDLATFPPIVTSSAAIASPHDSAMSAFFSESRTQATELRMGMSKISDKIDLLSAKMQELQIAGFKSTPTSVITMDPTSLVSNVQALVEENQVLKKKVEEQRDKLDSLNERVYNLLELNHKSIGNYSVSSQDTEELKTQLCKSSERISSLEGSLKMQEEQNSLMSEKNSFLHETLENLQNRNVSLEKSLEDVNEQLSITNQKYLEAETGKKRFEEANISISSQQSELSRKCAELEDEKNELIEKMQSQSKELLELQNGKMNKEQLISQLERTIAEQRLPTPNSQLPSSQTSNSEDVKSLMNIMFRKLQTQFEVGQQYSGDSIKRVLASTIRDMTLEFLQSKNQHKTSDTSPELETPISELDNNALEPDQRIEEMNESPSHSGMIYTVGHPVTNKDEDQSASDISSPAEERSETITEDEPSVSSTLAESDPSGAFNANDSYQIVSNTSPTVSEVDVPKQKEETDSKYSTYDQSWRPTQPPPLPLFDDDEENDSSWWQK